VTRARTYMLAAPVAALFGYVAAHAMLGPGGEHRSASALSRSQHPVFSSPGAGSGLGPRAPAPPALGASRSLAGIPVGFSRSPAGAVTAAGNYLTVLARSLLPEAPWSWAQAIHALTVSPLSGRAIAASGESAQVAARLASAGASLYVGSWLLGYRVWSSSLTGARVAVWSMGVMTSPVGVVAPAYSTTTCTLRWVDGDWKISDAQVSPGPTPPSSAEVSAAPVAAFSAAARQFSSYHDVP